MNRREKWILALAGPLVLFLLTIQGIGLWILGPFHKILVDHATEAMLAETAVVRACWLSCGPGVGSCGQGRGAGSGSGPGYGISFQPRRNFPPLAARLAARPGPDSSPKTASRRFWPPSP